MSDFHDLQCELENARDTIAQFEAQAAAMHEALEHCKHRPHEHNPGPEFTVTQCEVIDRALASDAGKALLERLEGTEKARDANWMLAQQLRERAEKAERERDEWRIAAEHPESMHAPRPWVRAVQKARARALEEAAKVAESYEPECESCPRGVVNAILALKEKP